jgi:hypothetical protein
MSATRAIGSRLMTGDAIRLSIVGARALELPVHEPIDKRCIGRPRADVRPSHLRQ